MNSDKHLRTLKNRALKGNLVSMFEIYKILDEEKSPEVSKQLSQIVNYISNNPIKLKNLRLIDFRKFKDLKVFDGFDENLTVIIGNNGSGKTSILEAISKSLSWIVNSILKEDRQGSPITYSDIRNDSEHSADLIGDFSIGDGTLFSLRLSRAKQAEAKKRDSAVSEVKNIANVYREVHSKIEINLPLFACYLIERSYPLKVASQSYEKKKIHKLDAYKNCLDGSGKFEFFVDWFIAESKKSKSDSSANNEHELGQLNLKIKSLENALSDIGNNIVKDEIVDTVNRLKNRFHSLKKLGNDAHNQTNHIQTVVEAICTAIPSIEGIWLDNSDGLDEIKVKTYGSVVNLNQLSDGQRILLTLVADIARRLVLLNPLNQKPLTGHGIILIDELELHLHPSWQQKIVCNLRLLFPNIQFIIATHSPLILSTVNNKSIRVFASDNDGQDYLAAPDFQSSGSDVNDVLEQVMGTNSTPDLEIVRLLDNLIEQVEIGTGVIKNEEFERDYNKIMMHFGSEHSTLKFLNKVIKLSEFKNRNK
jgi:predicted ATP-binding protein involved in virulence